jgi:hypothetical protein
MKENQRNMVDINPTIPNKPTMYLKYSQVFANSKMYSTQPISVRRNQEGN